MRFRRVLNAEMLAATVVGVVDAVHVPAWREIAAGRRRRAEARARNAPL